IRIIFADFASELLSTQSSKSKEHSHELEKISSDRPGRQRVCLCRRAASRSTHLGWNRNRRPLRILRLSAILSVRLLRLLRAEVLLSTGGLHRPSLLLVPRSPRLLPATSLSLPALIADAILINLSWLAIRHASSFF